MTPICLDKKTGSSSPETSAHLHDAEKRGWRRRVILCVDDDPVVLSLQSALLTAAGFSVITSKNGSEALDLFSAELPDAVVLDYALPGTAGPGLAAQMRRIAEDVPLILNSGFIEVPPSEAALFDRVLPKGLAPGLLVQVLCEIFPLRGSDPASTAESIDSPPPAHDSAAENRG